jgi:hypothetical protein
MLSGSNKVPYHFIFFLLVCFLIFIWLLSRLINIHPNSKLLLHEKDSKKIKKLKITEFTILNYEEISAPKQKDHSKMYRFVISDSAEK